MTRRKSDAEHALAGTLRADRRRRRAPVIAAGTLTPPASFSVSQKRAWQRLVACAVAAGRPLVPADAVVLAAAAQLLELHDRALLAVRKAPLTVADGRGALRKNPALQIVRDTSGQLLAYLARLGLTPLDRSKMEPDDGADEAAANAAFGAQLRAIATNGKGGTR